MAINFFETLLDRDLLTDLLAPSDIEFKMTGRHGDDAYVIPTPDKISEIAVCKMIKRNVESFDWDLIRDHVAPLIGVPYVRIEADYREHGMRTILVTERLIPMKEMMTKIIHSGGDDEYKYETIIELFRMKIHASSFLLQETGLICDSDPSNFGFDPISKSLRLYDYGHLIPLGTPDTIEITEENLKKAQLRELGAAGRYKFYKMTDLFNVENLECSQRLKLMLIEGISSIYKIYESKLGYFFQIPFEEILSMKEEDPSSYYSPLSPLSDYRYEERQRILQARIKPYEEDITNAILLPVYEGKM